MPTLLIVKNLNFFFFFLDQGDDDAPLNAIKCDQDFQNPDILLVFFSGCTHYET